MLNLWGYAGELREWICQKETVAKYRTKATFFTRNTAKLTFERLVTFILGNNRNSAQVALNDFFRDLEEETVAKQTLFEAREKISYEAFAELNEQIVNKYYGDGGAETYKGYTLLGVDGSVLQAPQGALEAYGGQKSARCETVGAQARAVMVNDLLNRITIAAALEPVSIGERKIFLDMLEKQRGDICPVYIFDRGFYSEELASAIQQKGLHFLFRIKRNCQKDIDAASEPEQVITVGKGLKIRIINVVLPTGDTERLATNIFDGGFERSDFAAIYEKRWGIEISYLMLKERLAIENFTSASKNLMLQDFYAAVATYNLMEIACMEQEAKRKADNVDEGNKNGRSANRNIVAHEVRQLFLEVMLERDVAVIDRKMAKIEGVIYRFFKDVHPNRSCPRRTKFPNKKFPGSKKRNL